MRLAKKRLGGMPSRGTAAGRHGVVCDRSQAIPLVPDGTAIADFGELSRAEVSWPAAVSKRTALTLPSPEGRGDYAFQPDLLSPASLIPDP